MSQNSKKNLRKKKNKKKKDKREKIVYTCEGCGAKCCNHVTLSIDKPTCKTDYDEIIWFLLHEGVSVFIDHENDWSVEFQTKCTGLSGEFCGMYEDRPKVCSDYDIESCVVYGDGPYFKVRWEERDEFIAWMDKEKIKWRFKKYGKKRYTDTLPGLTQIKLG